jgi:hypothetical protein
MEKAYFLSAVFLLFLLNINAQKYTANYDEGKVPPYTLPDPLKFEDGNVVRTKKDWEKRRSEIFSLFQEEVYGINPRWGGKLVPHELSSREDALNGTAMRKEIKLTLVNGSRKHEIIMLLYLPKIKGKAPLFIGYNFEGNHTVTDEKDIIPANFWPRKLTTESTRGSESDRGKSASAWQVKEIISRGYGLATIYYGDVDPDFDDNFKNGIHSLFDEERNESSWGSIAAWSWGLSRALDYLETVPQVDSKKVVVMGHSRLGKTALWAGATDKRFAIVISNNSGCGGAALSKRIFGETVAIINNAFPHWFCDNFNKYSNREDDLPVDQHQLLALIAPRPVYVASAEEDKWADPKGEFLACKAASPVYTLLGKKGLPASEMPPVNSPVMGTIGYHIRTGGHAVTLYDWQRYLDFADIHFGRK